MPRPMTDDPPTFVQMPLSLWQWLAAELQARIALAEPGTAQLGMLRTAMAALSSGRAAALRAATDAAEARGLGDRLGREAHELARALNSGEFTATSLSSRYMLAHLSLELLAMSDDAAALEERLRPRTARELPAQVARLADYRPRPRAEEPA